MAPGYGRRASSRTPRGLKLLLFVVLALLVGRHLLRSLEDEAAAGRGEVEAGASSAAAAVPKTPPYDELTAIEPGLQAALDGVVDEWLDRGLEHDAKLTRDELRVTYSVRELSGAREVAARDAERALRPASCMQLMTTAAALVLLGSEFSFETLFESTGPIEDGVLQGDLVVRADADPLYEADGRVAPRLVPVVRDLRRHGIQRIEGDIVLDEASFPDPAPAPAWPSKKQHWQAYCALAGGFSAASGCLTARVDRSGETPRVEVFPRHHGLGERLDVEYGPKGSSVAVNVGAYGGKVHVRGKLPRGDRPWSASFAHPDPVLLFGAVVEGALAEGGIALAGEVVRRRGVPPLPPGAAGSDASRGRLLASLSSPLAALLAPINTESHNATADQVFLAVGRAVEGAGTRTAGERASARALSRLGVDPSGLVQVDGSGLSRDNRVNAHQLAAIVHAVLIRTDGSAEAFLDSLAVGGRTGTLDGRMRDERLRGRVHAKSGWISGTSALAGVVETVGGRRLAFSILVEYPRRLGGWNKTVFKPMQDELCLVMALDERAPFGAVTSAEATPASAERSVGAKGPR